MSEPEIGIIGAGAWGTALAQMLAADGREVLLWAREEGLAEEINERRINSMFLPAATLAPSIRATGRLADAAGCQILLLVTPAQHLAAMLAQMPAFPRDLVLCSKGIDAETGRMMHEVAAEAAPDREIAVLSGPTFAHEVAAGLPTAVTLACGGGEEQWRRLAPAIARPAFRLYYSDDVVGAEVGGAVKNVLAIACGVVEGLRLGQNARAALIARGFAEMTRFGLARGARRETLAGLSGLGDLVLTCSSTSSRNFSLGKAIGEGRKVQDLMRDRRTVAEGAHTAPVLNRIALERDIDMPIVGAVAELLEGEVEIDELLQTMLSRPPGDEED